MNIKDLIINGIQYAKYVVDKDILYFKCTNKIGKKNIGDSEQILICIIKDVCEEKFKTVAYLPE